MRLGALAFSPPLSYISQVVKAPQLQSSPYVAPQVTQHFFSSQRGPVLRLTAARRTAVATDDTSDSDGFSSESLSNFRSSQPRRAVPKPPSADVRKVTLALLQLLAVVACLILLPAWLCCKTIPPRAWLATALYTVFFGAGALRRTLKYGKLSSRKKDAQVSTEQGKWAIILFVVLVVAGKSPNQLNCQTSWHLRVHVHWTARVLANNIASVYPGQRRFSLLSFICLGMILCPKGVHLLLFKMQATGKQ